MERNTYFPVPVRARDLVSRDRFGRLVPRQPAHHLHTQAQSDVYSRDSSRFGGLSLSDESFPNGGARGAFAKPSRSVSSRRLRGASKAPPRTLRGGLRTLRGGCTYRRLHEDALEGSRGLGYTILRATILIYNIGT